jgi:hypothetical protein
MLNYSVMNIPGRRTVFSFAFIYFLINNAGRIRNLGGPKLGGAVLDSPLCIYPLRYFLEPTLMPVVSDSRILYRNFSTVNLRTFISGISSIVMFLWYLLLSQLHSSNETDYTFSQ